LYHTQVKDLFPGFCFVAKTCAFRLQRGEGEREKEKGGKKRKFAGGPFSLGGRGTGRKKKKKGGKNDGGGGDLARGHVRISSWRPGWKGRAGDQKEKKGWAEGGTLFRTCAWVPPRGF